MELLEILRSDGAVKSPAATLTPLTGGVSSEIYRVDDGGDVFVVKRALAKLKVQQDWFADVGRNRNEAEYLRYVGQFLPEAVPRVRCISEKHGYFCMEFLGSGFENWKQQMLAGRCDLGTAAAAGRLIGTVHRRSRGDEQARDVFNTVDGFEQLRIDPYLLATTKKHPDLAALFLEEAERLRQSRRVLTHGDFSPKNILVSPDRLVLVDCEVAWFGDAAFDAAFLLNHLLLKSIARPQHASKLREMAGAFWRTYTQAAGPAAGEEADVARLLLMLMLARVDGKSPVEYLDDTQRDWVRAFAVNRLKSSAWTLAACMPE